MIKCQECGQTGEVEFNSNDDTSSDFMMWPSHTNKKGLNIYVFFCFSCGTFNEASPNFPNSREEFEYFRHYALEENMLKKWCYENNVPVDLTERMVKVKAWGKGQFAATWIPTARDQRIIALVTTIVLVLAVVLAMS